MAGWPEVPETTPESRSVVQGSHSANVHPSTAWAARVKPRLALPWWAGRVPCALVSDSLAWSFRALGPEPAV